MGTDNLHHKRKARKDKELKRPEAKRQPYNRVLIVCEDSDSTPSYLEAICADLKLNTANIKICGKECGYAPKSVVEYAKGEKKDYDKTYCVIDRDKHPKFQEALQKARNNKIEAIISIPCFEYWLLLHFEYTDKPFQAAQNSNCEEVIKSLREYLTADYKKSENFFKSNYPTFKERQSTAIKHAKQREQECQHGILENPCTQMHLLIEYLNNLKNEPEIK